MRPTRAKAIVDALGVGDAPDPRGPQAYSALVMRRSLLGRLPGARPAPLMTRLNALSGAAAASFVREGAPIPLSAMAWDSTLLSPGKLALITPITNELLRSADPAAVGLMEGDLTRALAAGLDAAVLDGLAAEPDGRPASILWGLSAAGGGSPSDIETDVTALVTAVRAVVAEAPVFLTSLSGALNLSTLRASDGSRVFPDVTLLGGTLVGAPLLISPAAGARLIFLDGAALLAANLVSEVLVHGFSGATDESLPTAGADST